MGKDNEPEGTLEEILATRATGTPVRVVKSREEYEEASRMSLHGIGPGIDPRDDRSAFVIAIPKGTGGVSFRHQTLNRPKTVAVHH
jgi:hypothetical protein